MRHHSKNKKLSRVKKVRTGLMRSLANSLIRYNKIKTTEVKARALRPLAEKIVTKGKKGGIANIRLIRTIVGTPECKKIIEEIAPKYKGRSGGYTRIIKLGARKSDGSKMAVIEFV
ncbi:MAG: 50S ribosomal protein L17 [Candidatus Paceibacterota bacterium]